jgi:UDP-N-acetylglucosamine 4,6-dehydratase
MQGGEIFVPRIPSMKLTELARVIDPACETKEIGIRPGEKLHEVMIPIDDGRSTIAFPSHFVIVPQQKLHKWNVNSKDCLAQGGVLCPPEFYYGSDNNTEWLDNGDLGRMIANLDLPEAREWARERGLA